MPQEKVSNYADSVRAWASGYKDSVAVDYDMSQMRYVYVHKDHKDSWRGGVKDQANLATTNWQYWMVPTFFAIMATLIIFAFILYRDNNKALKETPKESILSRIKKSV
tara:strand:- start:4691 stop:5014 length:324 start_codon:yes stop_codon:yes gene_type:complete